MGTPTKTQAESSIKSLAFELGNLTPSAMVVLFEIDLSKILESKSIPNLTADAEAVGFKGNVDNVLRFHNNIKVFNSKIIWNGNDYYPVPIQAQGFENSSRGTLPTPTLSISSQSEENVTLISLLKHEILKIGDIIGAKVTRRRTFAKYLDWANFQFQTEISGRPFSPQIQELPDGYEPDPNAELPKDVYFIERKTGENKTSIQYQLSSILDLEGTMLPRRTVISDRCSFAYRGPGCWYEHIDQATENKDGVQDVPILQKAELSTFQINLPDAAPPVATDKNELIASITGKAERFTGQGRGPWKASHSYEKNDFIYIIKDKIKYYFVAKQKITQETNEKNPPPNTTYWIADECSKNLQGCKLRWGTNGSAQVGNGGCPIGNMAIAERGNQGLPYGGFPAARKVGGGRG